MNSVTCWTEQARYDLETARAMLATGRYLYVVFCCQQTIEKVLKAIIVHQTQAFPPRLHNLSRLADLTGIALDQDREAFIGELSAYYIQTRYPEEIKSLGQAFDRDDAVMILGRTEEMTEWLLSMLK